MSQDVHHLAFFSPARQNIQETQKLPPAQEPLRTELSYEIAALFLGRLGDSVLHLDAS
jgi:hypothetical protein